MRLNPKIYDFANGVEPVTVQEFDGRKIEVFYMNDFNAVFNQNAPKGKFAVWASVDGFNYRLFVEKGYYEEIGELYTAPVNKIWLDFWDKCDDTTKKYNFRIMLPMVGICLVLYLLVNYIPGIGGAAIYIQVGIFALFIIGMIMLNRTTKKKLAELNANSVGEIKKHLGAKHFDELLDKQKKYIDKFFEEQARLSMENEDENKPEITEENPSSVSDDMEVLTEIKENNAAEAEKEEVLQKIEEETKDKE